MSTHFIQPFIGPHECTNTNFFVIWSMSVLLFYGNNARPIAKTENGPVRGIELKTYHGRRIFSFYNIPYSLKIMPRRRFEEVRDPGSWETLDASGPAKRCPQISLNNKLQGEEDCLVVNVFSPVLPNSSYSNRYYPVIVYIHGGAYYFLSGADDGPRYLLDSDVVFVTVNYRLGVPGFGSTGDNILPGNLGLKDQIKALQWIQRNIRHFNGDKNSVTLVGMSAGAACIHFLYFSKKSKGLFHRGYIIGGTATQHWSISERPKAALGKIARRLGCSSNSSFDLVFCLERLTAKNLALGIRLVQDIGLLPLTPVAPVVDEYAYDPFLPIHPYDTIRAGTAADIPLLISNVMYEGLFPGAFFTENPEALKDLNENWYSRAPDLLALREDIPERFLNSTVKQIRQFYFGEKPIDKKSQLLFLKMMSDRHFLTQAAKTAALQARTNSRVYYYIFDYKGGLSTTNFLTKHPELYALYILTWEKLVFLIINGLFLRPHSLKLWAENMGNNTALQHDRVPSFATGTSFLPLGNRTSIYGPYGILVIKSPYDARMTDLEGFGNVRFWESLLRWTPMKNAHQESSLDYAGNVKTSEERSDLME